MNQPIAESAPILALTDRSASDPTGHPVVDEVLRRVAEVEGRPLEEQVRVLDAAHARLQAVLADDDADPADDLPGAPA